MTRSSKLLKQLGHPSGFTGKLVLRALNRVNGHMNDRALDALDVRDTDRVLEIGFGGGSLIARILQADKTVHVTGADISKLAVKTAGKRFRKDTRVSFKHCVGDTIPFEDSAFTQVAGVNVIYFWPDVPQTLSEIYRGLVTEGKLVLCYSEQSPDEVTCFDHKDVEAQLQAAGFATAVSHKETNKDNSTYYCTVATKATISPVE